MASLATIGTIAGIAGTGVSAAGTLLGGSSSGTGAARFAGQSSAIQNRLAQGQSKFAAKVSKAQGKVGAAQIKANQVIEDANIAFSANIQSSLSRLNGAIAKSMSEFEAKQIDVQAKQARAVGQDEMFEVFRQLKLQQSDLQAQAAASGFMATDATALDVAGDLESYGYLQGKRAYARGEETARGFERQAAGTRLTGQLAELTSGFEADTALAFGGFQRKALRNKAAIEARVFKNNKSLEAGARTLEAFGFGQSAKLALLSGAMGTAAEASAASANRTSSLFNAGSTILGGVSKFGPKIRGLMPAKTNVSTGVAYG